MDGNSTVLASKRECIRGWSVCQCEEVRTLERGGRPAGNVLTGPYGPLVLDIHESLTRILADVPLLLIHAVLFGDNLPSRVLIDPQGLLLTLQEADEEECNLAMAVFTGITGECGAEIAALRAHGGRSDAPHLASGCQGLCGACEGLEP
jgi:hypothetical protein